MTTHYIKLTITLGFTQEQFNEEIDEQTILQSLDNELEMWHRNENLDTYDIDDNDSYEWAQMLKSQK